MSPDDFQQAWRAQAARTRVTIDAALLLEEVQRDQRAFRAMILGRDSVEILVALVMIPVWFYLGALISLPWTWYLGVPALLWMAGFMLVFRLRHPQRASRPDDSLLECVKNSLRQVENQIWLLRNVLWWYLLPPGVALTVFFVHVAWQGAVATDDWLSGLGAATFLCGFVSALYYWIYRLNQRAVDSQLEPKRQELLMLVANLGEDSTGDGDERQVALPALPFTATQGGARCASPKRIAVSVIAAVAALLLVVMIVKLAVDTDPYVFTGEGYPKRSPFTAVRWQGAQPEVEVGGQWYRLESLNDVPTTEIVAFSRKTFGDRWRKRFEEDLVEVLTRMGRPPQDKAKLVVQSPASSETQILQDVPMTYANRRAIRAAAQTREKGLP
ncbi:MAG: hypothetical protein AAF961_04640 [Planctomycetota bacterium]